MARKHCLEYFPTPSLILDESRMTKNIARLREQAAKLGISLRPHLKTLKSLEVAKRVLAKVTARPRCPH